MEDIPRGLAAMGMAQIPSQRVVGNVQVTKPFYGEGSEPVDQPAGEEPMMEIKEKTEKEKLLGQFQKEIDLADNGRRRKEHVWRKVDHYMKGIDTHPIPDNYEESTFFYHRLPRVVQSAKVKLVRNVMPLQGRAWEIGPSPRSKGPINIADRDAKLKELRAEVCDIHEAMDMDGLADDMCEFVPRYGGYVVYGPIQFSQPRIRWENGSETVNEEDALKPIWQGFDPKHVYPDPNARKVQDLEYVYFHRVLSAHQIRTLEDDETFIKEELATLIDDLPTGNWASERRRWEEDSNDEDAVTDFSNRYVTWMRIGYLTAEALEALGEKVPPKTDPEHRAMTESLWEIWFCGHHILKISKRKFQPKKMPVYFIPFRRDPTSLFGIGAAEAVLSVLEMLVNICRAIEDDMNDTSGYQAMIDAGLVVNKDYRVAPRKAWIYNSKGVNREKGPSGKPVDFFSVPSNLPHLLECFRLFESMIPICSGVPEAVTGKDMGSGVRTDTMHELVWEGLEEFLRDVVGNIDRFWWKPHLQDVYGWIQTYYVDRADLHIDVAIKVEGVRGALRREIVGRKVADLFKELNQFGMPDWFDEVELGKIIAEGLGVESETAIKTVQQYIEAQELKLKKKELEARAGMSAEIEAKEHERAHTSSRDAMIETLRLVMASEKPSALIVPLMERVFKLTGQMDERAVAALSIQAKLVASEMYQLGVATDQERAALEAPVRVSSPLEMVPEERDPQQAAQAAQAIGQAKNPPSDVPVPAMPTTQPIIGAPPGAPGGQA